MSYRVEVASTGRAGCQSTECKKESVKIGKNELRLGSWVEIPDRGGSWRWRHWGCVTGKILLNIRHALDQTGSGDYQWEALDGYQGQDEKNSLDQYPDLQKKVRRVITQGFIDPEDFKGDAEMNKLGCTGLRLAASKKKRDIEDQPDLAKLREQVDRLAAERRSILSKGGSLSKIDAQLQIVEDALGESERANSSQKKPPLPKKKAPKKRARRDDQSEVEDFGDVEQQTETPPKKKRISAKDRIAMEKAEESKNVKSELVKEESAKEGIQRSTNTPKKQIKSSSNKIKKENENENENNNISYDIEENSKPIQNKKRRIKKEVDEEEKYIINNSSSENKKPIIAKNLIKKEDDHHNAVEDDTLNSKPAPIKKGHPRKKTGNTKLSN